MDIAHYLHQYGYLAIALGSFLEGEVVLLAGSFAASQGHFQLKLVFLIAALASFLGDLPYFFAGRRYGASIMARYPSIGQRRDRLDRLLHRHHLPLVLSLRFLYGVRIAGLLTLGMSTLPAFRFLCLDFIGALIWSLAICTAGYGAGRLSEELFGGTATVEQITMMAVLLLCSFMLVVRARRRAPAGSARVGSETESGGV
jgi:membrane protein DedA with SNARE-associated domain